MKNLFLIRGIPGSGKTTLANLLPVDRCIAADDYHYDAGGNYNWKPETSKAGHAWCQREVEVAMEFGYSIAVHNTFTTEWEMQPYFDMAEQYGYRVTTIIVENRHKSESVHNVPEETIQKMKDRFEVVL